MFPPSLSEGGSLRGLGQLGVFLRAHHVPSDVVQHSLDEEVRVPSAESSQGTLVDLKEGRIWSRLDVCTGLLDDEREDRMSTLT